MQNYFFLAFSDAQLWFFSFRECTAHRFLNIASMLFVQFHLWICFFRKLCTFCLKYFWLTPTLIYVKFTKRNFQAVWHYCGVGLSRANVSPDGLWWFQVAHLRRWRSPPLRVCGPQLRSPAVLERPLSSSDSPGNRARRCSLQVNYCSRGIQCDA